MADDELKMRLVEMINTFADAKVTSNQNLMRFAGEQLDRFLQSVEIKEKSDTIQKN